MAGCADHEPVEIGTRDADGNRTHTPPGDVCSTCSDFTTGRMVPVTDCPTALAKLDRRISELYGSGWEGWET